MLGRRRQRLVPLGAVVMALAIVGAPVSGSSHEMSLVLDPIEHEVEVDDSFRMTAHLCPRGRRPGEGSGCRRAPARTTWAIEEGRNRIGISRRRGHGIRVTGRRVGTAQVVATLRLDASRTFISRTHVHVVAEISEPPPVPEEIIVVHRTDVMPPGLASGRSPTAGLEPGSERPGRMLLQAEPGDTTAFFRADTRTVPTYMAYRCPADERGFAILSSDGIPGTDDDCTPEVVGWQVSPWAQAYPGRSTETAIILTDPGPHAIVAISADGLQGAATLDVMDAEGPGARLYPDPPITIIASGEMKDVVAVRCTFDAWQATGAPEEGTTSDEASRLFDALLDDGTAGITGCEPLPETSDSSWSLIGDSGIFDLGDRSGSMRTVTSVGQGRAALVVRAEGVGDGIAFIGSPFPSTCPDTGLPGDYNDDGVVDAADYVVWRRDPGSHGGDDGYDVWVRNFGRTC